MFTHTTVTAGNFGQNCPNVKGDGLSGSVVSLLKQWRKRVQDMTNAEAGAAIGVEEETARLLREESRNSASVKTLRKIRDYLDGKPFPGAAAGSATFEAGVIWTIARLGESLTQIGEAAPGEAAKRRATESPRSPGVRRRDGGEGREKKATQPAPKAKKA